MCIKVAKRRNIVNRKRAKGYAVDKEAVYTVDLQKKELTIILSAE